VRKEVKTIIREQAQDASDEWSGTMLGKMLEKAIELDDLELMQLYTQQAHHNEHMLEGQDY